MRVLAVGAHPDDLEITCGGTLAKYTRRGDHVVMCHVTKGDKGHFHIPSEELAEIRENEARAAARIIGAETISMGFLDGEVPAGDLGIMMKFVDVIRQVRPDVIVTHAPSDYHSDHTAVSKLVVDASFHASVPYVRTQHEFHAKVAPIYHMDTYAGLGFSPCEFVDITETLEIKKEMLSQHQSQLVWLKEHDDYDMLDSLETVAKYRGTQCGVRYAEGFAPCLLALRVSPARLLP